MKILLTMALENEFAPWRRLRGFKRVAGMNYAGYDGKVDSVEVRVALTGVGAVHARAVAAGALQWMPNVCISSGFAGSLRATYCVGDVFAAREVMEMESGRTIAVDPGLLVAAEKSDIRVVERLLSSSNMVVTAEGKSRLGRMAEAVEMESFAVLTEAASRNIPAIAIRAVSDAADEDLPMDFSCVLDHEGKVNGAKVARSLVRAPRKLPALLRLGRNSHRAAAQLAEFLDVYIRYLGVRPARRIEMAEATKA
ncbi:MAG: phosphorylase family protein [Candidatus Acidiferrales bacterium]